MMKNVVTAKLLEMAPHDRENAITKNIISFSINSDIIIKNLYRLGHHSSVEMTFIFWIYFDVFKIMFNILTKSPLKMIFSPIKFSILKVRQIY